MANYKSQFTGPQIDEALSRATSGGAIDTAIGELAEQAEGIQNKLDIKADVFESFYNTGLTWSQANTITAMNTYVNTVMGGFDNMPKAIILSFRYTDVSYSSYIWMKQHDGGAAMIIEVQPKDGKLLRVFKWASNACSLTGNFGSLTYLNRGNPVNEADTGYGTYKARGEALFSADTNPTVNGAISWKYE